MLKLFYFLSIHYYIIIISFKYLLFNYNIPVNLKTNRSLTFVINHISTQHIETIAYIHN